MSILAEFQNYLVPTCCCPCAAKATGPFRPAVIGGSFIKPVGCIGAPFQLSGEVGWYSGGPNGGNPVPGPKSGGSVKKNCY